MFIGTLIFISSQLHIWRRSKSTKYWSFFSSFPPKPTVLVSWLELWSHKELTLFLRELGEQTRWGWWRMGFSGGKGTNESNNQLQSVFIKGIFIRGFRVCFSSWSIPMALASSPRAAVLEIKTSTELNLLATVPVTMCRTKMLSPGLPNVCTNAGRAGSAPAGNCWPVLCNWRVQKGPAALKAT